MTRQIKNLAHQAFGRFVVLGEVDRRVYYYGEKTQYVRTWKCRCICGNERLVSQADLVSGHRKSCGCSKVKHGIAKLPEYNVWQKIIRRCEKTTDKSFPDYGGRGITVCDRWRLSPETFLGDMGHRPTPAHSIEREDNNGNYAPDNCRWALRVEQANNKRSNHLLAYDGKTQSLTLWSRETKIHTETLRNRLKLGWTVAQALTVPVTPNGRPVKSPSNK